MVSLVLRITKIRSNSHNSLNVSSILLNHEVSFCKGDAVDQSANFLIGMFTDCYASFQYYIPLKGPP